MNEIHFEGPPPIDGYGPGGFRIAGSWHEGSVLVDSSGVQPLAGLTPAAFAPLIARADGLDLVLIGTGPEITALPPGLTDVLEAAGLGVEYMATPSACRTYNVLLTEDRRIAAALVCV